jgi:hypothetical protein
VDERGKGWGGERTLRWGESARNGGGGEVDVLGGEERWSNIKGRESAVQRAGSESNSIGDGWWTEP